MKWDGRVTEAEGDSFWAILTPADHGGPELIAEFSMRHVGIEVEPGDVITVTPESVVKVDLGVWTQEEIDRIRREARKRAPLFAKDSDEEEAMPVEEKDCGTCGGSGQVQGKYAMEPCTASGCEGGKVRETTQCGGGADTS